VLFRSEKTIPEYTLQYKHPFLENKGVTPELAEEFEMGYYANRGIMAGKIAIKIRDAEGNKIAYIGRNIKENGRGKYFFFKGYRNEHLYNLHRIKGEKSCILTVSPFEVVKLHKEGRKNAIALLNSSMSKEQEALLRQFEAILVMHSKPDNQGPVLFALTINCLLRKGNQPACTTGNYRTLSTEGGMIFATGRCIGWTIVLCGWKSP
jgi:hypothetical protein